MKPINQSLTLAVIGLLLLTASSQATTRNWTGAATNNYWSSATNWDTYPSAPAANGDTLVFTTATHQNMTNDYTAITNTLTFANGGWTLSGSNMWLGGNITSTGTNAINVNTPMTAARTITVSQIGDQLTMNGVLSGAFALTKGGGGTLVLTTNNTYTGGTTIAASTGIVRISNTNALGTGAVTISKGGVVFNGFLQLSLTGANTITNSFAGFSSTTTLGDATVPCIENLSGTNTILSGLQVTGAGGNGECFKSSGGLLTLAGNLGPTITSRGVELNGAGNGMVNGAITNGPSSASFTIWKDGTGTWTLNGTNLTSGNLNLQNGKIALGPNGSISNMPIVMASGGSLDVSAVTGGWTMPAGKPFQGNGIVYGNVSSSAPIMPGQVPALYTSAASLTAGTLSFSNNLTLNGATLNMNLSSDPTGVSTPNDLLVVAGNLTVTNVSTISLGANPGSVLSVGTYPIIKFGGTLTGAATNFTVANFPTGGRGTVGGYVVTNPTSITLVVTGTPPANLVWRGDGLANNWDVTTTLNWWNTGTSSQDEFYNNDAVVFNDTSTNMIVNLNTTVTPGFVAVNSTSNYTFTGSGTIAGANGLIKSGSGALTNNLNNSYTGSTTVNGGTLVIPQLGTTNIASPVGASLNGLANLYLNGGTLEITGAGETTYRDFSVGPNGGTLQIDTPGAIEIINTSGGMNSGPNTFTKTGPGTLTSGYQQVFEGTNNIFGGILKIPTIGWFGVNLTTPVFINNGELDLNGQNMSTKPVVVQGMGDPVLNANSGTTNGAIINNAASQTQGLQFVTMTGDTAFGGTGRWDIRANSTAYLSTGGNAYNLVKAGANQISLVNVTVDPALANIDIQSGIFSYELNTTGLGNPTNTLTVENGATLDFWATTTPLNKQIVLHDNTTVSASSGASTIVGPVNMLGDTGGGTTFSMASGVSLILNGAVSGAGNLNKTGAGTMTLTATNNYTGTTTVTAGKLIVSSGQTGGGAITVNDGTVLGVTVAGLNSLPTATLTLGSSVGPVTNEFTALASTTTAPVNATNLVVNGPVTINILSGNFLAGHIYPLISFGSISGSGSFVLGTLPPLVTATVVTNGSTIALNVSSAVAIEYWTGIVNSSWDINATTNWIFNSAVATYADGNTVQFDDSASNTTVTITTAVKPKGIFVNNITKNYSVSGSPIVGTNNLTKQGAGALTLYSSNSFSGGIILSAGTLNIDNNGALGTGLFTVNGGAIDNSGSGPVTVTNAEVWNSDLTYVGNQALTLGAPGITLITNRQITASGASTLTISGVITDGGAGYSLTQAGAGTLALSGTNTYTGGTTVSNGTVVLQGDQSRASGGLLLSPLSYGGTVTIASGAIVSVAVTNHAGVTNQIQIGSITAGPGSSYSYLNVSGSVTNNGLLLAMRGSVATLNTNSTWLQNGDMQITGEGGFSGELNVTAGGSFTFTGNDTIQVNGSSGNSGYGLLYISGLFTTSAGFEQTTTPSTGYGFVELLNGGILRLSATVADITTNAVVNFYLGTGGGVIDTHGFSANLSYPIYGPGNLTKTGMGTLILNGADVYTGDTIVNAGTLALDVSASVADTTNIVVAGGATLDVSATSLSLSSSQVLSNSTSTATLNGNINAGLGSVSLTYASGTPSFSVTNGTLTLASTTVFQVNNTGAPLANGTYLLITTNLGGTVTVSDSLPPVTVTGGGLVNSATAVLDNTGGVLSLDVTGGVSVNTSRTNIIAAVSGSNLNLSWPADHTGWRLLAQTNHLASGISANTNDWGTVAGSVSTNKVSIPIDATKPAEFYRLVYP